MNDRSTPDNTLEQPPASYAGRTRFTQLEYEAVLANASIGIAFTRDRKFFLCNPKFADLFGWHPDELIGQAGEVVYASRESYEALGRIAVPVLTAGKHPMPGYAPGVSTRQTTGSLNFSASFMARSALRYPSGWARPK